MTKKSEHLGSSLDEWLEEEGLLNQATAKAIKSTLAWQMEQAMKEQHVNKAALVRELRTSKAQVDRLLDPLNTALTLRTLTRVAQVLGKDVEIQLVDRRPRSRRASPTKRQARSRRAAAAKATRRRR
jgi:antitoxin HicB